MDGYYGQNTLYRLLRPLAITELIEQQITYADSSVDLTAIALLRFKRAVHMALTDGDAILDHPKANWSREIEHLFSGTLSSLANSLIIEDDEVSNKKPPMHYHEFEALLRNRENLALFSPLAGILWNFNISDMPIFWARLICFGYICNEYVRQAGNAIGFECSPYDLDKLLSISQDDYILTNLEGYKKVIQSLADIGLSSKN